MLAGVVREKTIKGALACIRNCEVQGATGIDLHLSCLEKADIPTLKSRDGFFGEDKYSFRLPPYFLRKQP